MAVSDPTLGIRDLRRRILAQLFLPTRAAEEGAGNSRLSGRSSADAPALDRGRHEGEQVAALRGGEFDILVVEPALERREVRAIGRERVRRRPRSIQTASRNRSIGPGPDALRPSARGGVTKRWS